MISNHWVEQRRPVWARLDALVHQTERFRLNHLSAPELSELGLLYRQTAADLSAVRSDPTARPTADYLNRLMARAHHVIYRGNRSTLRGALSFMLRDYPRVVRRLWPFVAAAFLVFFAGGVLGTLLTLTRPQFMREYLGPPMVHTIEQHKMWTDSVVSMKPQASAEIMTNNIGVTFAAFAFGVSGGLLTLYLLFQNGILMGVIATACAQHGLSLSLWSFVASHGALELPAIFLAGGAGLRLGWGICFPGLLGRREALALAGSESVKLLAGTVPMLVVAGILEGFVSPTRTPVAIKFGICAALLTTLWFWWASARDRRPAEPSAELPEPTLA